MAEAPLPPAAHPRHARTDQPLVWLTSFPKSGNTWTRILIAGFLGEENAEAAPPPGEDETIVVTGSISSSRPVFDNATGLPSSDLTPDEIDLLRPDAYRHYADHAPRAPLFVKTHDGFQRNLAGAPIFPPDRSRGAILIVRHPMDVALSLSHHIGDSDPRRAVTRMCNPDHEMAGEGNRQIHQRTLGWSGHYLSWTRQDVIPVLVVRYEDMLADTALWLGRMLAFLGMPGAGDTARIAHAVAQGRFDRLQAIERRSGFGEIPVKAERFFRSGRAGEGIEQLSEGLRRRVLDAHGPVMAELGYSQHGAEPL